MKIAVTIDLKVQRSAQSGIGHNGRAASRFKSTGSRSATGTGSGSSVKGMQGAKLMADFMGHIIYIKGIANGIRTSGSTPRLVAAADATNAGKTAAGRSQNVTNIIISCSNKGIQVIGILSEHGAQTGIGVRVID